MGIEALHFRPLTSAMPCYVIFVQKLVLDRHEYKRSGYLPFISGQPCSWIPDQWWPYMATGLGSWFHR